MAYRNEAAFSRHVQDVLRGMGYSACRIESAGTSAGLPDLHVTGRGVEMWLELKNMPSLVPESGTCVSVAWRPGQAAWAAEYAAGSRRVNDDGMEVRPCSWTLVACAKGVLAIAMRGVPAGNRVWLGAGCFIMKALDPAFLAARTRAYCPSRSRSEFMSTTEMLARLAAHSAEEVRVARGLRPGRVRVPEVAELAGVVVGKGWTWDMLDRRGAFYDEHVWDDVVSYVEGNCIEGGAR